MPRRSARPQPDRTLDLTTHTRACPACGGPLWAAYKARRTVITLDGLVRLRLQVRRCRNPDCPRRRGLPPARAGGPLRPAAARVRPRRHRPGRPPPPRRAPQRPGDPRRAGPPRRADLRAQRRQPAGPLRRAAGPVAARTPAGSGGSRPTAGRVILAIDGLQPDVGHEVLWVLRDVPQRRGPAGPEPAVLDARTTWPSCSARSRTALAVPIAGVVSDGQDSIRKAVAEGPATACPTSSATSTTCARRPGRSTRPTATPRSS